MYQCVLVLHVVVVLVILGSSQAGEDFLSSWGYNDPLIDVYAQHSLCVESKSYYVNISLERSLKCPQRSCSYDSWRNSHYFAKKYSNNLKYALRPTSVIDEDKYLYSPTNLEHAYKSSDGAKYDEIHPRKVVVSIINADFGNQLYQIGFGQMVAEQHDAAYYVRLLDEHYKTGKESSVPSKPELEGYDAIRKHIDPFYLWELLPDAHPDKQRCLQGNVTFTKRIYDIKHPDLAKERYNINILDFVHPERSEYVCLVIMGFFRNSYPCERTVSSMWNSFETETEQERSSKSLLRKSSDERRAQRFRNVYQTYKNMASRYGKFTSNGAASPIVFHRTKPKQTVKKTSLVADHYPASGHIIEDTSYNRDNNPDLLLKRLRHKKHQKKSGQKGGLFLDGIDIT